MKVKMLVTVRGTKHNFDMGEVVEVEQEIALQWQARKVCEILEAPKRQVLAEAETAEANVDVEETVVPKKGRGKK